MPLNRHPHDLKHGIRLPISCLIPCKIATTRIAFKLVKGGRMNERYPFLLVFYRGHSLNSRHIGADQ